MKMESKESFLLLLLVWLNPLSSLHCTVCNFAFDMTIHTPTPANQTHCVSKFTKILLNKIPNCSQMPRKDQTHQYVVLSLNTTLLFTPLVLKNTGSYRIHEA